MISTTNTTKIYAKNIHIMERKLPKLRQGKMLALLMGTRDFGTLSLSVANT
jgi:hypothetical protein